MGKTRVYLDSYYLLEVIKKGMDIQDAERLLYKISKPGFEVFIPQTVLGEITAHILKEPAGQKLFDRFITIIQKYNIDAQTCLIPPNVSMFDIMNELNKRDQMLDGTDIIITAQALGDPDSKFFFTFDSKLLKNKTIDDYEIELRDNGVRNESLQIKDRL